jgi:hypothetical protein
MNQTHIQQVLFFKHFIESIRKQQTAEQSTISSNDIEWERKKKNNEAAKRSRDARRAKHDEISLK